MPCSGERGRPGRCFWRLAENLFVGGPTFKDVAREARDTAGEAPALPNRE